MDKRDAGKVIPFSPAHAAAAGPSPNTGDAMRDRALSHRRGLDTVEPVPQARTATRPAQPKPELPAQPKRLGAPALSAMFIASLDDMICERKRTSPIDLDWPERTDKQLEQTAVDIVDMLFGFVLDDPQIPGDIKDTVLAMQLPMLRMATSEIEFFADWLHPARLLLNDIAPLFRTYRDSGGAAGDFSATLAASAKRMLGELTPNGCAFAALHGQLREFVNGTAAQSTQVLAGWQRAEAAARVFFERPMPQIARDFVAAHWIDVLERTAAQHPEDSPQWQDALAVVEDLAWSLTPKIEEDERCRLIALIPALLTRLNRGLDLIEVPRDERRPFFDALIEIHATVLKVETAPSVPKPRYESASEQVARLQRGDWVEFKLDDGSMSRGRLTWISPQRGILVFSNQQGQRATQIAPEDLIDLVRQHKATLIFDQSPDAARDSA